MSGLDSVEAFAEKVSDRVLREALEDLVSLVADYHMVKDDDRCECDTEGEGPCVWCRMKETVEKLTKESEDGHDEVG